MRQYQPTEETVKDALEKSIQKESFWSVETIKTLLENDFIPSQYVCFKFFSGTTQDNFLFFCMIEHCD